MPGKLIGKGASRFIEHDPRHMSHELRAVSVGRANAENMNPAILTDRILHAHFAQQVQQAVAHGFEISCRARMHHDQVNHDPLPAPMMLGGQDKPQQFDLLSLIHAHEQERIIPRYTNRPKIMPTEMTSREDIAIRMARGAGLQQPR